MSAASPIERLRQRVERAEDLPTLPTVVTRLGGMLRDPRVSASAVGEALAEDPVLTARILRLVNSAYYGFPQRITNVPRAIVILGFQKIENLVMAASVFDRFAEPPGVPLARLWEHAMAVAVASEALAESLLERGRAEAAFVAGLLHDIGKVVLAHLAPAEFSRAVARAAERDVSIRDAEREIFGTDHAEAGFWLARRWGLPEPVQQAIRFHHAPQEAREGRTGASLVHLADLIARGLGIGWGGDPHVPAIAEAAWDDLSMTPERADRGVRAVVTQMKRAQEFFRLVRGDAA